MAFLDCFGQIGDGRALKDNKIGKEERLLVPLRPNLLCEDRLDRESRFQSSC